MGEKGSAKKIISPIAIDLGAGNTGVYFAHYEEGSTLEEIEKEGRCYQLEESSYTFLMANRTAGRHQRRGFDRRQMAKRLVRLIWEKHFNLPWSQDTQKTLSFLINRRGFTFLTEEYDAEVLKKFPEEAYDKLPSSLKENVLENDGFYDYAQALQRWAEDKGQLEKLRERLLEKPREISKEKQLNWIDGQLKKLKAGQLSKSKEQEKFRRALKRFKLDRFDPEKESDDLQKEISKSVEELVNRRTQRGEESDFKKSPWHFNAKTIDLEKINFNEADESTRARNHLHHLAYSIDATYRELDSGARHRRKYFKEIEEVLGRKDHVHGYLKNFCSRLQNGSYAPLNPGKLARLIAHVSNFELKPLRNYFNNPAYKTGDRWDGARLKTCLDNWICNQWRVSKQDNRSKSKDGVSAQEDYRKLREECRASDNVIDFWMGTDPERTIPPYQNNNNRRPPKCQSLILNVAYLQESFSQWREWLEKIIAVPEVGEYLGDYEEQLKAVKSGKGRSYFGQKLTEDRKKDSGKRSLDDLRGRVLQFIFDRAKANDPLKLNEIYSQVKKYNQKISTPEEKQDAKKKLEDAVSSSTLPEELKSDRNYSAGSNLLSPGSFLHLVCKYYKLRQRARDGRIFIHPQYKDHRKSGRGYENTGYFADARYLLTYCNHKPRQKRYQMLNDLAGVFQVHPRVLEEKTGGGGETDILAWLKQFKAGRSGLEGRCKEAAELQKEHRGALKMRIDTAFWRYENKRALTKEEKGLKRFCENSCSILTDINDTVSGVESSRFAESFENNPSASVYLLAQIHNIAFKDRQGNASTCAVCSADNAQRMQNTAGEEADFRAQRLPAIATRLIDGGVMRMARILGKAIARDKWEKIKEFLENGREVYVPIVTESNQFEFEPSKENLVKRQRVAPPKSKKNPADFEKQEVREVADYEERKVGKEARIRESVEGICPYCGKALGDGGEIDHIIPRASQWGTLNDEANLIYAHQQCNKQKGNTEFSLGSLNSAYLEKQFGTPNPKTIADKIVEQIGDGEGDFKFGKYRNFSDLLPEDQKCFRHALFMRNHPLRKAVIRSINNRDRAFVNGTQRYFAEVLANELHKKALEQGWAKSLRFDYFGVPSGREAESVFAIRDALESSTSFGESLKEYRKYEKKKDGVWGKKKEAQKPYSHFIDAQIAFMISLSQHQGDGAYKLDSKQKIALWGERDTENENGEGNYGLSQCYRLLSIDPETFDDGKYRTELKRGKTKDDFFSHRSMFNSKAGAWHFLKLISIKVGDDTVYVKGFLNLPQLKNCLREEDWKGAIEREYHYPNEPKCRYGDILDKADIKKKLPELYQVGEGDYQFGYQSPSSPATPVFSQNTRGRNVSVFVQNIDKRKVAEFLIRNFHTKSDPGQWDKNDCKVYGTLSKLWYFTRKKSLKKENPKDYQEGISFQLGDFKFSNCIDPSLLGSWQKLAQAYDETRKRKAVAGEEPQEWYPSFLSEYFKDTLSEPGHHQKVRREFSLPKKAGGQGFMLIRRRSWNGEVIYQCQSEDEALCECRDDGEKFYYPLVPHFRSENIVLLRDLKKCGDLLITGGEPVGDRWYPLDIPENLEKWIESIENQYQSKGDSNYRIRFKDQARTEGVVELMLSGFHIDEMKVGQNEEEKRANRQKIEELFKPQEAFLSVSGSREILHKKLTEDPKGEEKKFLQKWRECFNSIEKDGRTMSYKRGQPLRRR